MHVLAHGGMLPLYQPPEGEKTSSPRRRGVKQGALLILIGAILVPIMGVMSAFAPGRLENVFAFFAAISALLCFLGGPLRMLFAAVFEEPAPKPFRPYGPPTPMHTPQHFTPQPQRPALTPPPARAQGGWRSRPNTAELANPPSVTENTTRLLEKEDRTDR